MKTAVFDITAIGNAIVDILGHVDDTFLTSNNMTKGSMQLVEAQTIALLHSGLERPRMCSGGSAANTVAAMAELGARTCLLGRVADDSLGKSFVQDIHEVGVEFNPTPVNTGKPTAACVICVTPDGERTMNTYIGACAEFSIGDVNEHAITHSRLLYIEGYMWDAAPAKSAIRHAVDVARANNVKIAFSTSDAFCVERHRTEFLALIEEHVDILFANEQEAKALFPDQSMQECAEQINNLVEIACITRSSEPAYIIEKGRVHQSSPQSVSQVVDATGAGDLFAAGFLHGWLQGEAPLTCAKLGHVLAGHIIGQIGARSTVPLKSLIT